MSVERERFRKGFGIMLERHAGANMGRSVMQGRRTAVSIDANQLPIKQSAQMRDPATGNFFFLLGFSTLGGSDVLEGP